MSVFENQAASRLRNVHSIAQLAAVLGVKTSTLSYWLYVANDGARYRQFSIPKKSGGTRRISAPLGPLKLIQTRLAAILTGIYTELERARTKRNDDETEPSRCVLAHGFKRGYGIISNARVHRNRRFVFNADLRDFFPSIHFGRVRGFLITDRNFRLDPATATLVAQIACFENSLPQGAPTSPVISNFIAHMLDIKLNKLARQHRCSYTRYADDLTFSTNEQSFPEAVARLVRGSDDKWVAGDGLLACTYAAGFSINPDKSRMQLRNSRQDATGLIVNRKVNVRVEYYKRARAMCDHLFKQGYCYETVNGNQTIMPDEKLDGMMTFIHQVRSQAHSDEDRAIPFTERQSAFSELYIQFLDYRMCHGITLPRIVCEGKTDPLHIRAAIQTMGALFPNLYDAANDKLRVTFYNFTRRSSTYQISGGTQTLKTFISEYTHRTKKFLHPVKAPVLVVVDNDAEAKGIWGYLRNKLGPHVDGSHPFYHVVSNLYVVPLPKLGGADTSIEDLHQSNVLGATIDGRTFSSSNSSFDTTKFFGKLELATRIVRPNRKAIDWSGFEELLKRMEEAIKDYADRTAPVAVTTAVAAE